MELNEAISLIQPAAPKGNAWADLGAGSGLFTAALANLLTPGSTVYAIDKERPGKFVHPVPLSTRIIQQQLDFVSEKIQLTALDGFLMANSLHYVKDKRSLLQRLVPCLNSNGMFIIVEYETTRANPWVPYPITFAALSKLFEEEGFRQTTLLGERNSVYQAGKMYAAAIQKPDIPGRW